MNFLMVTGLVVFWFIHGSYGRVWQNKDHLAGYLDEYYSNLSKIPPRRETAAKFAKYFLDRHIDINNHARRPRDIGFLIRRQVDTVLIIDSSESVKRANFTLGLRALQRMVERGKPDTHYAAITFSNHAKLEFVFLDKEKAKEKLKQIEYRPGKTNTQEALKMALNQLMRSNTSNIRVGSIRRILLVTDGLSNVQSHRTLLRGWRLRVAGAEIFVMAVGQYDQGFEEIIGLASSTHAHLYRVANMKGFLRVMKLIPIWPKNKKKEKSWLSGMNVGGFPFKNRNKILRTS